MATDRADIFIFRGNLNPRILLASFSCDSRFFGDNCLDDSYIYAVRARFKVTPCSAQVPSAELSCKAAGISQAFEGLDRFASRTVEAASWASLTREAINS